MATTIEQATELGRMGWKLDATYAGLPEPFSAPATPSPVKAPQVVLLNRAVASDLGLNLDTVPEATAAALFAGQILPEGAQPIAQAYAGHQFGHFTMLGDGRAILLGEQRTPTGRLVDVQWKGTGRTYYSRGGDGRAALGPMLREYIISESLAALGIPTTRSLAVVTTGEMVYRNDILPGAVLTRIAASHLRVGTFEYAAARRDEPNLRALADYAIARHDPHLLEHPDRYRAFYQAIVDRQAALIARWQLVGFIHGVMNTDNMSISGESIDFGPCAFMNRYRPDTVFSSIDQNGRYAYANQPGIAQWNLARLAEAFLPLLDPNEERAIAIATEILEGFAEKFSANWLNGMRSKLGLTTERPGDHPLVDILLHWMEQVGADFTTTFRDLSKGEPLAGGPYDDPSFVAWYRSWQERLAEEQRTEADAAILMQSVNPRVIPRNHRVEEALAAAEKGDLTVLHRLLAIVTKPFDADPEAEAFMAPPVDDSGYRTFCGT